MQVPPDTTGVLIVRVWAESGAGEPLRFRITRSLDVADDDTEVQVASSVADVVATVERWVDDYRRWLATSR